MGYLFWQKLGITKGLEYERQLKRYIKLGYSQRAFEREMIRRGLSYRRQDMLRDWRMAQSIEHAKTIDARMKARAWFEDVIEPLRKERKITYDKAIEIWREIQHKEEEFMELTPEEEEVWTIFEEAVYGA